MNMMVCLNINLFEGVIESIQYKFKVVKNKKYE